MLTQREFARLVDGPSVDREIDRLTKKGGAGSGCYGGSSGSLPRLSRKRLGDEEAVLVAQNTRKISFGFRKSMKVLREAFHFRRSQFREGLLHVYRIIQTVFGFNPAFWKDWRRLAKRAISRFSMAKWSSTSLPSWRW